MRDLWPIWVILAATVAMFVGDWRYPVARHEAVTEINFPRHAGWIRTGVEIRETECGFCFVKPVETIE